MRECMIDIETLDVARTAVVMQVGVVFWEPLGMDRSQPNILFKRNYNLDVDSQIAQGRTIRWDTLKFWMGQPDGPRESVIADDYVAGYEEIPPTPRWMPGLFFAALQTRYQQFGCDAFWAKGSFDFDILESLAEDMRWSGAMPWSFRTKRDLRTMINEVPSAKTVPRAPDLAHTGMDDCIYQISQLEAARERLLK